MIRDLSLAAAVACGLFAAASAQAQSTRYIGAGGPIVLKADPDSGLPLPSPRVSEAMRLRAVPVPSVMNGSAFGPTGNGYYSDSLSEGHFNTRRGPDEYVLAPALRMPAPRP